MNLLQRPHHKFQITNRYGFTLIELLVSISIIAILTALLTANFIGARQRGRDGVRKADLRQMQAALELYRTDNGFYPTDSEMGTCGVSLASSGGTVYMQEIPCDDSTGQAYTYTASPVSCDNSSAFCTTYYICACLENSEDQEVSNDPTCTTTCNAVNGYPFRVTNP